MAKNTTQKTNALGLNLDPETFKKEVAKEQGTPKQENDKPTHTYTHTDTYTDKETKKKRTNGLVKQSVFDKVSAYADATGTSYNAIVCDLLDKFIEENGL